MKIAPILGILTIGLVAPMCKKQPPPYVAVSSFDAKRYMGTWYEIARLPNSFEKLMTNVTATYSLKENGKVKVDNKGIANGKRKQAIGKAFLAGAPDVGHFKVSFFGPFYADYVVVDLDENYTYALIASSPEYLWILSRSSTLSKDVVDRLLEKAKALGFDTNKLYFTPQ
jgi:apolipoprotein D and lipocalin family protein